MNELEMRSYLEDNFDDLEELVIFLCGLMDHKQEETGIFMVDSWRETERDEILDVFIFSYKGTLYKVVVYDNEYLFFEREISDLKIEIVKKREKVVYEYYTV